MPQSNLSECWASQKIHTGVLQSINWRDTFERKRFCWKFSAHTSKGVLASEEKMNWLQLTCLQHRISQPLLLHCWAWNARGHSALTALPPWFFRACSCLAKLFGCPNFPINKNAWVEWVDINRKAKRNELEGKTIRFDKPRHPTFFFIHMSHVSKNSNFAISWWHWFHSLLCRGSSFRHGRASQLVVATNSRAKRVNSPVVSIQFHWHLGWLERVRPLCMRGATRDPPWLRFWCCNCPRARRRDGVHSYWMVAGHLRSQHPETWRSCWYCNCHWGRFQVPWP